MESGSAATLAPAGRIDRFEEYRLLIQSTEKLTDRRQLSSQVWVTLHTLLFAALGFLTKEAGSTVLSAAGPGAAGSHWIFVASVGPLIVLGIFSCLIWVRMLSSYRSLIAWRYDQLMELERSSDLQGLHKVFNQEWEHFFGPDAQERIGFTRLEARLPIVLMVVYAAFGIVALLVALGIVP